MSRSVSAERPKSSGRIYTDEEWEAVKNQFHYYYMEKGMSLKDAAKCMSEKHGFEATLRQWERRIAPEKWGFSKYASRDDRLKAIDASGKSLLDVSQRGRRKSTASDGRPSLLEDRNLRRFARREVSRESRHRARSVSVLSDQSDQDMSDNSAAPSPAPSDLLMDTQESGSFSQPNYNMFGTQWVSNDSQDSALGIPQIRIFDQSRGATVPQINISGPEDAYIAPDQIPMMQAPSNTHYPIGGSSDPFGSFIPDDFEPAQPHPNNYAPGEMAGNIGAEFDWGGSVSAQSQAQAQKSGQDFATFGFDNDTSMSYTDMLQQGIQLPENAGPSTNIRPQSFGNEATHSHNTGQSPDSDLGANPDFDDPTYVDVFELLKERDNKIMQMIAMLKQSYLYNPNAEHSKKHVINSINLLEQGVNNQNRESERDLRRTLKNIYSTQRRATQDIHNLSTQRRRKVEQLQAQIDALSAPSHQSFTYG